ncbi:hypothetical protein WP12_11105 [Sphingomonas sp. SRS2]|nr:hypothetical protein WP12_11105 [Sphingomonas sp. SRS2]
MDVLNAIISSRTPMSLIELSDRTQLAPSKLHRYLVSLSRYNMVRQHQTTGLYDVGSAAISMGLTALSRFDGFDLIHERVTSLSKQTGFNTFVCVWTESGPVLVQSHNVQHAVAWIRIGSTISTISSAAGPIFVAYLDRSTTERVIARDTASEDRDLTEVIRWFDDEVCPGILEQEVYWTDGSVLPHFAACAAPVFDMQGQLYCAMGVSVPLRQSTSQPDRGMMDMIRETGRSISRELGYAGRRS